MSKPKIRCPGCGALAYLRIKTGQIVCNKCSSVTPAKGEVKIAKREKVQEKEVA